MAHQADSLKETLSTLQDVLPVVPDRLKTLLAEEASLRDAAEEFLQSLEEKQAEASELFARIEAVLGGMRRHATEQAQLLQQYPDFEAVLGEDKLDFEEKVSLFLSLFTQKQQAVVQEKKEAVEKLLNFDSLKQSAMGALRDSLGRGESQLTDASQLALRGAEGLQTMVEASRTAITDEVERLGAEIEAQRAAGSRDLDQMKQDVEGFEAVFADRIDLLGNLVRRDTDRIMNETRNRMADLRYQVSNAVEGVQTTLRDLDSKLRDAIETSAEARQTLGPLFDNVEKVLEPLKEAIESVREAANVVGVPF